PLQPGAPSNERGGARPGCSRIGSVPQTIHSPSACACSRRNACAGPSPGASAAARRSASTEPRNEKFSGSTASAAPPPAAARSRSRAASRFAATSRPLVIWIAAALTLLMMLPSSSSCVAAAQTVRPLRYRSSHLRRARVRRQLRADLAALELLRRQPLHRRRLPAAGDAVRRATDAFQRLLEDTREDQQRRRDPGSPDQPADRRQHL